MMVEIGLSDTEWGEVLALCVDKDPKVAVLADSVRRLAEHVERLHRKVNGSVDMTGIIR